MLPNGFDILQAVIEATPDAIFVKDLDGRYLLVNEAAARFVGKPAAEIVGRRDRELYEPATADAFVEADRVVLADGRSRSFEGVAVSEAFGRQAYLVTKGVYRDPDGVIRGVFGISHDVTELRRANESLAQARDALFRAQKMEAVGQLTGGIAHDFNNILAVILGNVELLLRLAGDKPPLKELLDTVARAALHGKDLTQRLLAFSRRGTLNPQTIDVNLLVKSMVRLASRTLGESVSVATELSPAPALAFADPAALEGALLNIALNARDAMPKGGSLLIRTTAVDAGTPAAADDDLQPGRYVVITLEDTGTGMTPDVAARAFEPFFTTKAAGGSGLGLSMVYGFTKQSGGAVRISSSPGAGTAVSVYLPQSEGSVADEQPLVVTTDESTESRVILLVEDEPDVRDTVRRQLESIGHVVATASGAPEALAVLRDRRSRIDVMVTDVVLRVGPDGLDLARAALDVRPGLPVIFMSGYSAAAGAQQRIRDGGWPLISKPFSTLQLETAIELVCGGH